jgi:hypothetical protein
MRDSNIVKTIKILGAVELFGLYKGIPVTRHPPQLRKHMIKRAAELSPLSSNKHFRDALAHCLAYCNLKSRKEGKDAKRNGRRNSGNVHVDGSKRHPIGEVRTDLLSGSPDSLS